MLFICLAAQAQPLDVLWEREGIDDSSRYGSHVFALGDQNDDGFADWGVSGPSAWPNFGNADPSTGRIELFYGGNPPAQQPYRIFGTIPDSITGIGGASSIGDLNGDGKIDYIVRFWVTRQGTSGRDALYFGGRDPARPPDILFRRVHDTVGRNLIGIGDFNGDGFDDLLDRSVFESTTQYIYFGGAEFDTFPDWQVTSLPETQSTVPFAWGDLNGDGFDDLLVIYDRPGERFGIYWGSQNPDTVPEIWNILFDDRAIIPSVNADGACEVVAPDPGALRVFLGRDQLLTTPDYVLNVPNGVDYSRMIGIGDFNDDGYHDFVGLTDIDNNAWWGQMSLYLGYAWLNPAPVITISGRQVPYNLIGIYNAAGLGDVNDDGVDDFIVGAHNQDFDGMRGKAILFSGDRDYRVPTGHSAPEIPEEMEIKISPNPFNSTARINLSVPVHVRDVSLTYYDITGRQVEQTRVHALGGKAQAMFGASYETAALPSGIYLLLAQADHLIATQKLLLIK